MNTSENLDLIAAALAKAQGEFKAIPKNKTGKVAGENKSGRAFSYEYKYAALPDVLDGIRSALAGNGLMVTQPTLIVSNVIVLRTRVIHSSGQWIESDYPVCSITGEHQKMGAAMTYARRYALTSLIGVAADEDVDGNGAEGVRDDHASDMRQERPSRAPAHAREEALAYVESAEAEMADIESTDRLSVWWAHEAKNRTLHFTDKNDPLLKRLKDAVAKRGAELAPQAEAAE